jgi:hypothetical protein
MNQLTRIQFDKARPFFDMVMSFLAATVGLGPVFDPKNPLSLSPQIIAIYQGNVAGAGLDIDTGQIHNICSSGVLTIDTAVKSLCGMLINTAYESVSKRNDKSPEFEFFRHVRHAVSHGNRFNFFKHEPARPASWRNLTIDSSAKGSTNRLYGVECIGATLSPADAVWLLHDIETRLP